MLTTHIYKKQSNSDRWCKSSTSQQYFDCWVLNVDVQFDEQDCKLWYVILTKEKVWYCFSETRKIRAEFRVTMLDLVAKEFVFCFRGIGLLFQGYWSVVTEYCW